MNCYSCQYFADFSDLKLGLRCMNKKNSPIEGDFKVLENGDSSCDHYSPYTLDNMFEWDENKNLKNQKKHHISFERIKDLINDKNLFQMVEKTNKWEDVSNLPDDVERNEGNTDPIRGKYIGLIDNNIYTAIYTFRGAVGEMRARVISLRRADKNEIKTYEHFKESKT
jgi:uncharacterized DUF497 family protein